MAALICAHVRRGGQPILHVQRQSPVDPQDSGWTFSCGEEQHDDQEILVVALDRYFDADPTLNALLDMPLDYQAYRQSPDDPWVIEPL